LRTISDFAPHSTRTTNFRLRAEALMPGGLWRFQFEILILFISNSYRSYLMY
jgi:hypothetical protein